MSEIRWESNGFGGRKGFRLVSEGVDAVYRDTDPPEQVGHRIRYHDSRGARRSQMLRGASATEAKAARHQLLGRKRTETVLPTKITFREAGERWYREGCSHGWSVATKRAYQTHLNHLLAEFGRWQLQKITTDHVAEYLTVMREANLSRATLSIRLMIFSGIYRTAIRQHPGLQDPSKRLERRERASKRKAKKVNGDDVLSRAEIDELLAAAPDPLALVFESMIVLGTRISELLNLRWCDVDFDKGVVYVRPYGDYRLKTPAANRTLRLPASLALRLKKHRLQTRYSDDSHTLFATEQSGGGRRNAGYVNSVLKRITRQLGWQKEIEVTTHLLRHTCASILISEHRADITYVQYVLGHDDLSTTQDTYLHLFHPEERVEEMAEKWQTWFYGEEAI
jgi:integrase